MLDRTTTGRRGETIAGIFLESRGYTLLAENFRIPEGEVDIVAQDLNAHELVFIEVKTLHHNTRQHPEQVITRKKLNTIAQVAMVFCDLHKITVDWRIDIVAVELNKKTARVSHWKNISPADVGQHPAEKALTKVNMTTAYWLQSTGPKNSNKKNSYTERQLLVTTSDNGNTPT